MDHEGQVGIAFDVESWIVQYEFEHLLSLQAVLFEIFCELEVDHLKWFSKQYWVFLVDQLLEVVIVCTFILAHFIIVHHCSLHQFELLLTVKLRRLEAFIHRHV